MSHSFTVVLPAGLDLVASIEEVRAGIAAEGGTMTFDKTLNGGGFSVKGVVGSFAIAVGIVYITITKKPFIVSNGFVEKAIRAAFTV